MTEISMLLKIVEDDTKIGELMCTILAESMVKENCAGIIYYVYDTIG